MTSRKNLGKNRKLKKRMKGGNVPPVESPVEPVESSVDPVKSSVESAEPLDTKIKGGSSYVKYADNVFLSVATGIGLVGVMWFGLSRSVIKHKYSEALSYTLLGLGVLCSLFLILFKGVRTLKPSSGIVGAIKNILVLSKFLVIRSVPALLILVQLCVLTYIMYTHADYIFSSENIPKMFNTFNMISIAMVLIQCWAWKDKVKSIMSNAPISQNPMVLPGFILAAILSGISISQLYVILEYLKTDC